MPNADTIALDHAGPFTVVGRWRTPGGRDESPGYGCLAPGANFLDVQRGYLTCQEGTEDEREHAITDELTIGRGRESGLQIRGDSEVSRLHCVVRHSALGFFVEDQHSLNGTHVNGEPVVRRRLVGGETLLIGATLIRFRVRPCAYFPQKE